MFGSAGLVRECRSTAHWPGSLVSTRLVAESMFLTVCSMVEYHREMNWSSSFGPGSVYQGLVLYIIAELD